MSSKECFKCLETKPLEAFYRHPRMKDGRLNKCIECTKVDVKNTRLSNIEKCRSYDRERANEQHRVAGRAQYIERYNEQYPDRYAAKNAVNNAIRDGKLERQPCFICGKKAQAHHPDYSAPLAVSWLCPPHHKQAHELVKELV